MFVPGDLQFCPLTMTFELGRDICTTYLTAKFDHPTFSRSEVILQTNEQTDAAENMHLASLRYSGGYNMYSLSYITVVLECDSTALRCSVFNRHLRVSDQHRESVATFSPRPSRGSVRFFACSHAALCIRLSINYNNYVCSFSLFAHLN